MELGHISDRTKAGLAQRRRDGVKLGRKASLPTAVRDRIRGELAAGASLRQVAERLTADGVPTARGGSAWYASTVKAAADYDGQTAEDRAAVLAAKRAASVEAAALPA